MRLCSRCKSPGPYYSDRARPDGLSQLCKECTRIKRRAWRKRKPQMRAAQRKRYAAKYPGKALEQHFRSQGNPWTGPEYLASCRAAGNKCQICGRTQRKRLAADHDHPAHKPRGVLCDGCNRGLGYFRDNPENLEKAANYLRNPPGPIKLP